MVLQMVGAIECKAGSNRRTATPSADPVIDSGLSKQQTMGSVVHEDGEAQLAPANDDDGQHKRERVGPSNHQSPRAQNDDPGMQYQEKSHQIGALA